MGSLRRPDRRTVLRTALLAVPPLASLLAFLLTGCDPAGSAGEDSRGSASPPLLVLAASDLIAAFDTLVPHFEGLHEVRVTVVFGSSGNLATQIRHGAPADLFLSADAGFVDRLIAEGLIDPESRTAYAVGPLALVVPPGRTAPSGLRELRDPAFRTLAIANPDHAPYGAAAAAALRTAGIWDEVVSRMVFAENVAQAVQLVRTGNADAALVAFSLVQDPTGPRLPLTRVDPALHPPLVQVAGVVQGSARPAAASRFLEFLVSAEGQAILRGFGFEPPGTTSRVRK